MSFPALESITTEEEDLVDSITYQVHIPAGATDLSYQRGERTIKTEDGETIQFVSAQTGITQGDPFTLHEIEDNTTNIQIGSGKTARVVLICKGRDTDTQFVVRGSATADTADGTTYKTITNVNLDVNSLITVDEITLAASEFLTIEVTSSTDQLDVQWGVVIESI